MTGPRLVVEIPGNPWAGAINRRDRAGVTRGGRLFNRKQPGFTAYQATVEQWARQAARLQGVRFGPALVRVTIVLGVPDRRRRDLDGPIKAILDGCTKAGIWADDSQVWRLAVEKAMGEPRAVLTVRAYVDRPCAVC